MVRITLTRLVDGRIHIVLTLAEFTLLDRKIWLTESQAVTLEVHDETHDATTV